MRKYVDGCGVSFKEYRDSLPARADDFGKAGIVKDPDLLAAMHKESTRCQRCGRSAADQTAYGESIRLELHHIIGGSRGRSDERTNLLMLCHVCHGTAGTNAFPLDEVLWCKWATAPDEIDWARLAVLFRRFLPDPVPSPFWAQYVHRTGQGIIHPGELTP